MGERNVLVHQYTTVDLTRVAPPARQQYGDYVRSVARWLLDRSDS